MKKFNILAGFFQEAIPGKKTNGQLDLHHFVQNVLLESGYPVWYNCCYKLDPSLIGKVLTVGANGITFTSGATATPTNLALTKTGTTNVITNSNGTGVTLDIATATEAGLMSAADKAKLNAITGTNTGDVTVVDTKTIDLTVTGQELKADLIGFSSATTGQIPSKNSSGDLVWITPVTTETYSDSWKYVELTPTGLNTIPDLPFTPKVPAEVIVSVNGLEERLITVNASGVFSIGAIGYDIDVTDVITAEYFSN